MTPLWGSHLFDANGDTFTVVVDDDVALPSAVLDRLSFFEAVASLRRDATTMNEFVFRFVVHDQTMYVIVWDTVMLLYELDYDSRRVSICYSLVIPPADPEA